MSKYVQQILVAPRDHVSDIAATGTASGLCYATSDITQPEWTEWLSGAFTKTVRKVKTITKLSNITAALPTGVASGDIPHSYAYPPETLEHTPEKIRKIHVSGYDHELKEYPTSLFLSGELVTTEPEIISSVIDSHSFPKVKVDETLGMSTGKTAAQVSHAVTAWLMNQSDAVVSEWVQRPYILVLDSIPTGWEPVVRIVDNGLTEIPSGSETVLVF